MLIRMSAEAQEQLSRVSFLINFSEPYATEIRKLIKGVEPGKDFEVPDYVKDSPIAVAVP